MYAFKISQGRNLIWNMEVSASILNIDENNYIKAFYRIEKSHIDYFHIDAMDGKFVENNNIDLMVKYTDTLKNITNIPLSIHIMCKNVKKYIDVFSSSLPRIIYFHYESCKNDNEVFSMIDYIKDQNIMVGIAINPETDVSKVYKFLPFIHNILIMSVHPGKGGQEFIASSVNKIITLRKYIDDNNLENVIEIDGGINYETASSCNQAGADSIVVGSFLINSKDYAFAVNKLRNS